MKTDAWFEFKNDAGSKAFFMMLMKDSTTCQLTRYHAATPQFVVIQSHVQNTGYVPSTIYTYRCMSCMQGHQGYLVLYMHHMVNSGPPAP